MSSEIVGSPHEDGSAEIPPETERTTPPVDANAAIRYVDRWLGIDSSNPDAPTPRLPADWKDRARLVGTIVYHADGETTYEGFGEAKPSTEDQPIFPYVK